MSDSAKFKIRSKKDGMEPVVMALIRGIVMVGDVACAVNGIASPFAIRLCNDSQLSRRTFMFIGDTFE